VTAPKALTTLSRERQVALICAGLLLVAILGYFVLVAPKRSTAHKLADERAQVEAQIARNRASTLARNLPTIRASRIFRLTKAMPSDAGMPDLILELNQLASDSGITFDSIEPQATTSDSSYDIHPVSLAFSGNFYSLADFLFRLRNLVRVHNDKLVANGRMLALSELTFSEGENKFPQIEADLTVDSFVLGSVTAPGTPTGAPAGSDSASSSTSSTTTTTTTTQSASASAAPSP
jgi:Tfp pilus assembly protein PilO